MDLTKYFLNEGENYNHTLVKIIYNIISVGNLLISRNCWKKVSFYQKITVKFCNIHSVHAVLFSKSIKIWGGVNIKMVAVISIRNEVSDSPNENVVGKISDTIYE